MLIRSLWRCTNRRVPPANLAETVSPKKSHLFCCLLLYKGYRFFHPINHTVFHPYRMIKKRMNIANTLIKSSTFLPNIG